MRSYLARVISPFALIVCLTCWGLSQSVTFENGWKGIKLFETTRAEMEKNFGKSKRLDTTDQFVTNDEVLNVVFSPEPCTITLRGWRIFNPDVSSIIGYEYVIGQGTKVSIIDVSNPFEGKRIFNLPRDTVVEYSVGPLKDDAAVHDLKWRRDEFKARNMGEGQTIYTNPALGIEVHTFSRLGTENVQAIKYYAPAPRFDSLVCK